MNLKQVETFTWVAELQSFRAAAEKMHTTQPTISQRIAALEETLNVRLFERDARGIRLTAKGQEILPLAQRMVQVSRSIIQIAQARNAIQGTLRLGSTETLIHTWLDYFIDTLHQRYPALTLDLQVDTTHVLRGQLAARQIDLAFVVDPSQDPRERNLYLCDYDLAWIASPSMQLQGRTITIAELGKFPIITYPSVSKPYQAAKALLLEAGIKSPRFYGSSSLSTIIHMTRRGIGPSVIPPVIVSEEIKGGQLCMLQVDRSFKPLSFYACWVDSTDNHTLQTVAHLAQEVARDQMEPIT